MLHAIPRLSTHVDANVSNGLTHPSPLPAIASIGLTVLL